MYVYNCKVTRVLDGDTIDAVVDLGFSIHYNIRVRLLGINAPEIHTRDPKEKAAGLVSKLWLENWVALSNSKIIVRTQLDKTGKYGRILGELFSDLADLANGASANRQLVTRGLASVYDGGKR